MDQDTTEVQHRFTCAWSAYARHEQELTSESHLQRHRLHFFDAVVTPTINNVWCLNNGYNKRTRKNSDKEELDGKTSKSTNDEYDQDSSMSFENDTKEHIKPRR